MSGAGVCPHVVACAAATARPAIQRIEMPDTVGKGGTIMEGFKQACGSRIVFAGANGATPPQVLGNLIEALDASDMVIGLRRLPGSVITQPQPLLRRILSRCFVAGTRLRFALLYRGTQSSAKTFRREVAKQLAAMLQERHWAVRQLLCDVICF